MLFLILRERGGGLEERAERIIRGYGQLEKQGVHEETQGVIQGVRKGKDKEKAGKNKNEERKDSMQAEMNGEEMQQ